MASSGLTAAEALRRLTADGPNAMVDAASSWPRHAMAKLWAPIPWMLEAAIILQLALGDYVEASVVAFLLIANAALSFIQEGRAQATLDALKSKLALVAKARRDGAWMGVPAATLVVGDVIQLSLGSVVPADARLLEGALLLDQSMLTGESLPVEAEPGFATSAGALVRRGEAVAEVTATGARTKFGRTAELVGKAEGESSQQKAILRVVRNLALFNGLVTLVLIAYAIASDLPTPQIIPLILIAVLASIPVALPSMFTIAAAVGARALARAGVLPTRLSAVDEAGGIDILCCDKTGTLTQNALTVSAVRCLPGFDDNQVLAWAALASSASGQDTVDAAIRLAASSAPDPGSSDLVSFLPFDPKTKRAEASVRDAAGAVTRIVKGAYGVIEALTGPSPEARAIIGDLQAKGFRVLAVARGPTEKLVLVGLIALSDPPRADSAGLIAELGQLGVRPLMITGDASVTARFVGDAIGLKGRLWDQSPVPDGIKAEDYALFANILPEDKYRIVMALRASGHVVGMCGDGANDAPALRQAQMGIAVSSASDVAKSAAGMVLTEPGLGGVIGAIEEGRATFQRIQTYTMRAIIHKVTQVSFLTIGLIITGQAILTPMLMVLMMIIGDFLALSTSTDNVQASPLPCVWRIGAVTRVGVVMGLVDLGFCVTCLAIGESLLGLDIDAMRTLTVVTLVFSGQAILYVVRERRRFWSSWPGKWLLLASLCDLAIVIGLATGGILMAPLPVTVVAGLFVGAVLFALLLDQVKILLFRWLAIT